MQGLIPQGFDRFDIVEGYYWWLNDHHEGQWSKGYENLCRVGRYFKPSTLSEGPESDQANEVYDSLCMRHGCKGLCRPPTYEETELLTWFERDRAHVELRDLRNDKTLVEWWDEAVEEAIEDGFLKPRDYHGTAYAYWEDHLK